MGATADARNSIGQTRQVRPRDRVRGLEIPPTIEPSGNFEAGSANDLPATIEPSANPGSGNAGTRSLAGSPTSVSGDQLSQLFYQLQTLEQEVQTLRGIVEEQDHQIKRLQREQQEQYLDLDGRVAALFENRAAPDPATAQRPPPNNPVLSPGGNLTERDAYTSAFDAMRNRQFDESMRGFQDLIDRYPNGQYTPNAYYWIGEIHLAANQDAELARQSFVQVVSLYPDHQKAPDALYKLGVVYQTLGDTETALKYLNEVQRQHPNSGAANLAAKYAAEL